MTKPIRIYIAAPYTNGDVAGNVARAMEWWHTLADRGLYPFCPHLSHFLHMHEQREYEEWIAHDLVWLECCDAVLRLPGESPGADREVAHAKLKGIPVFEGYDKLLDWLRERRQVQP